MSEPFAAELLVDSRNEPGETPIWSPQGPTLFWIDVVAPGRVFYWDQARDAVDFYEFPELVTGLAPRANGDLLIVGTRDVYLFARETQESRSIFSLPAEQSDQRFNDGGCDPAGRMWIGSMQNNFLPRVQSASELQAAGRIYCIPPTGGARTFAAGLGCPNATCWSPDGMTFYIADSVDGWIYAYDFDVSAGSIARRRPLYQNMELGVPDGATVDEEGYLWNARWGAGVVIRISPDGKLDRIVDLPVSKPTACCFGGARLNCLYVTSARYGLSAEQFLAEPYAGGVFGIRTAVPGAVKLPFGA
jgi:sugar lactone lactonase YvrE